MAFRDKVALGWIFPLRLFAGSVFLIEGVDKLRHGWLTGSNLRDTLSGWLAKDLPYTFFRPFLEHTVLPHHRVFSILVPFGECAVGLALFLGLLTRPFALLALGMLAMFLLGRGDAIGPNPTAPMLLIVLTILCTNPGRAFGLDGRLQGKLPRWLV